MDINTAENQLRALVRKIRSENATSLVEFCQNPKTKRNMGVKGCNGTLWIHFHKEYYDISLSGQSLTKDMKGFMETTFGRKKGNKQSRPEPSHQPFWRVTEFKSVAIAVYRYAGLKSA